MSRRSWFFRQKMAKKSRNKTQWIVISKLHSLQIGTEIIGKGLAG